MGCGICGSTQHNRISCPTGFCQEILHELLDSSFTQVVQKVSILEDKDALTAFLLGTHDRTGEHSPVLALAGQQDILHSILSMATNHQSVLIPDTGMSCGTVLDDCWEFSAIGDQLIIPPYYDSSYDIIYSLRNQQNIIGHVVSTLQQHHHPSFVLTKYFVCHTEIRSFVVDGLPSNKKSCTYILNTEDIIKCYNPECHLVWRTFVPDSVFQDSITLHNNMLLFSSRFSSTVVAINKHSGKVEWQTGDLGSVMATPPHIVCNKIYVASKSSLFVLDPADGAILLTVPLKGIQHSDLSVIHKAITTAIYACDACREVKMITISPPSAYKVDTILTDISTSIAPIYSAKYDIILIATMDKYLIAFDNSKRVKRAKWRFHLRSTVVSIPTISHTGDYIYIGCVSNMVFKINLANGNLVWKFKARGCITDPIYKSMTNVIVTCRRSNGIYMLK